MNHYYQNIQGWFDFQDVYSEAVKNAKDGDVFIEVGSHKGRSAAYMAVEIINSGKEITFYCVDTWEDENIYKEFLNNIKPVKDKIIVIRDKSTDVNIYADFVFIDAAHDYDNVKADILHWKPLSKKIAGHDYSVYWPSVKRAVNECLNGFKIMHNSWVA